MVVTVLKKKGFLTYLPLLEYLSVHWKTLTWGNAPRYTRRKSKAPHQFLKQQIRSVGRHLPPLLSYCAGGGGAGRFCFGSGVAVVCPFVCVCVCAPYAWTCAIRPEGWSSHPGIATAAISTFHAITQHGAGHFRQARLVLDYQSIFGESPQLGYYILDRRKYRQNNLKFFSVSLRFHGKT